MDFGNPANMGICAACFIRDTSGGLGFQTNPIVQYIRPEIIALALGAFFTSFVTKSFNPVSGDSAMLRFTIAIAVMIGALVFLGCPTRLILRLAGGDLNAVVGLFGLVTGLSIGYKFKINGFSLGQEYETSKQESFAFPFLMVVLLILLIVAPSFIHFSQVGPASQKAPILISLIIAFVIGIFAYKTDFCFAGAFNKAIFQKKYANIIGITVLLLTVLIGNIVLGKFNLSFANQPIAHTDGVFNFLGMLIVGWGSVMLAGCPFRQLIKAGSGNANGSITILGFLIGGAIAHNFSLAASPAGVPFNGQVAVFLIITFFVVISFLKRKSN